MAANTTRREGRKLTNVENLYSGNWLPVTVTVRTAHRASAETSEMRSDFRAGTELEVLAQESELRLHLAAGRQQSGHLFLERH